MTVDHLKVYDQFRGEVRMRYRRIYLGCKKVKK